MKTATKVLISVVTISSILTSCSTPQSGTSTSVSTTVSGSSSASVSETTSDANETKEGGNAESEVIKLVAGKRNDYSEDLIINKGTEFEEKKVVYFLPQGKYSAKNVSSNIAQLNVYSREMVKVDGWEEPAETIFVKAFKTGEETTFEISRNQNLKFRNKSENQKSNKLIIEKNEINYI